MNVKPFKTYVLDSYIRIGDRVAVLIDAETRAWCSKQYQQLPDGKEGVVIGFNRYVKYVNRNQVFIDKAGEYQGNGIAVVKWDIGGNDAMSAHHIGPVDQSVLESRKMDMAYREAFDTNTYVGPLPSLPYWEGDIIRTKEPVLRAHSDGLNDLIITGIDYYQLGKYCNDGVTPMPIYDVKLAGLADSPSTRIRGSDITTLVRRGNYWKMEHNQPLVFKDVADKLSFYNSIGETKQVRNPATGKYAWNIDEVVEAIEAKTIDYCSIQRGLFGAPPMLTAYVIPNYSDIAEEARQEFNASYKNDALQLNQVEMATLLSNKHMSKE